ncbi:hypothetical protein HDU80_001136, partial [Chytriomyces hyalinus]
MKGSKGSSAETRPAKGKKAGKSGSKSNNSLEVKYKALEAKLETLMNSTPIKKIQVLKASLEDNVSVQDAKIEVQECIKYGQPEQEDATFCDDNDKDALPPRVATSQLILFTKPGPQDATRFKSYHDTLSKLLKSQSLDVQQKGRHWRTKANCNCYENNLLTELGIYEVAPMLTFKAQHKISLNMKSLANLWSKNAVHKTMLRKLTNLVEDGHVVAVEAVGDNIPEHPHTVNLHS